MLCTLLLVFVVALTAACTTAHYPVNPKLMRIDLDAGYRVSRVLATEPADTLFMHLSLSGGGMRAAAFGFGVLEALRDTAIVWDGRPQRLIDQLDIITAVSGGSILAASYALRGADGLADFDARFLNATLQQELEAAVLTPRGLWRIQSPRFGRGDLLAEHLDERLFEGATFADLARRPRKPFVIIYASDMFNGSRFEFVQDQFDYLCSDLGGVSLARAVAASSAVPMLLSPITLWNHSGTSPDCGDPPPRHESTNASTGSAAALRRTELESFRARDREGLLRPYVHLLDGGLSDNVGARGPMEYVGRFGSVIDGTRAHGYRGVKHAVFIVVNAETSARAAGDQSPDVPGPLRTALALADIPINRNSALTLAHQRAMLLAWEAEVREAHERGDFEVFAQGAHFHLVEVNLADVPDLSLRERLLAIPTTLQLPAADVVALRREGAASLGRSSSFRRLLTDLSSAPAPR